MTLQTFAQLGLYTFPLQQFKKKPIESWKTDKVYQPEDFTDRNIGLLLGEYNGKHLVCIDIDVYKNNPHFVNIIQTLGIENPVYQDTVSGGKHILMWTDKKFKYKDITLGKDEHIELRVGGQYIVAAPSFVISEKNGRQGYYELHGNLEDIPFVEASKIEEYFAGEINPSEISCVLNPNIHDTIIEQFGVEKAYEMLGLTGKRNSRAITCRCPLHDDKNPSFNIFTDTGISYCHTHNASYNIPGLAYRIYGENYLQELRTIYGVDTTVIYTLTTLSDLEVKAEREDTVIKYISESKTALDIVTDDNDHTVIAPTGAGKTSLFIDAAKEFNLKLLLAVPTKILARQVGKENNINYITGDTKAQISDITVVVYDSLKKLMENRMFDPREYILVIDEAHERTTAMGYRARALNEMTTYSGIFRKVVQMTGTAEDTIIPFGTVTRFHLKNPLKPKVVFVNNTNIHSLVSHILEQHTPGVLDIVYIDNSKLLDRVQELLLPYFGNDKERVPVVTSKNDEDPVHASIADLNIVPSKAEILLCTSILAEGLSIYNEKVKNIYTFQNRNTIGVRQTIARFRNVPKSDITLYEFLNFKTKKGFLRGREVFNSTVDMAKTLLQNEKNFISRGNIVFNPKQPRYIQSLFQDSIDNILYRYDSFQKDHVICYHKIQYNNFVHNQLTLTNHELRAEYYSLFEGWEVSFEDYNEDSLKEENKHVTLILEEREKMNKEKIIELLSMHNRETLSAYAQKNGAFAKNNQHITDILIFGDYNFFYEDHKEVFTSKEGREAIEAYAKFFRLRLSHNLIVHILYLRKEKQKRLYQLLLGYYSMKLSHNGKLTGKEDGISKDRQSIILWMQENILNTKEFVPADLLKSYNKMLQENGLAPQESRGMTMNIKELFSITRGSDRNGKEVLNKYINHGLYSLEDILSEVKLPTDYSPSVEKSYEEWKIRKLSIFA